MKTGERWRSAKIIETTDMRASEGPKKSVLQGLHRLKSIKGENT